LLAIKYFDSSKTSFEVKNNNYAITVTIDWHRVACAA